MNPRGATGARRGRNVVLLVDVDGNSLFGKKTGRRSPKKKESDRTEERL